MTETLSPEVEAVFMELLREVANDSPAVCEVATEAVRWTRAVMDHVTPGFRLERRHDLTNDEIARLRGIASRFDLEVDDTDAGGARDHLQSAVKMLIGDDKYYPS